MGALFPFIGRLAHSKLSYYSLNLLLAAVSERVGWKTGRL